MSGAQYLQLKLLKVTGDRRVPPRMGAGKVMRLQTPALAIFIFLQQVPQSPTSPSTIINNSSSKCVKPTNVNETRDTPMNMSTGDKFDIGSVEAPYQNISTKVLGVFREGGSMAHVILSLKEFTNGLEDPALQQRLRTAHITVDETIELLENDHHRGKFIPSLILSMNPLVLQSVLLGTIAKDSMDPNRAWPLESGPGVYAVGIKVQNRNGGFLTSIEMDLLADGCDEYAEAWETSKLPRPRQHLIRFASSVDLQIRPRYANTEFLAISSDADADRIRVFAQRLRHRAAAARRVDPTGNTIQMQTPLYVGCATNIQQRIKAYSGKPNFKSMNKVLGLVINLLWKMDLPCEAVPKSVMPVWNSDQLTVAERLVATLASSLVAQDGFNAIQAGGTVGHATAQAFASHKSLVLAGGGSWFKENLDRCEEALRSRNQFLKDVEKLYTEFWDLRQKLEWQSDMVSRLAELPWAEYKIEFEEARQSAFDTEEELDQQQRKADLAWKFLSLLKKERDSQQYTRS